MYKMLRIIALIGLLAVLLNASISVSFSKEQPMPGITPVQDEGRAIAIAQTVAAFNAAQNSEKLLEFKSVKQIQADDFQKMLAASEITVESSLLLDSPLPSIPEGDVWIVSFSGVFTPKRVPPGAIAVTYPNIDIILDARDGSVIGIQMHN